MGKAKGILLKPIQAKIANEFIKRTHYSGKVVQNSQLHIGVFYNGRLEGAMQFGPSLDKRKIIGLVEGTGWNGFLELNRLAFTDVLPRNSESRAISIAMKLIKKHAPHVKWVISFADATQCGDGTIYRASGFVLTAIKENQQLYTLPFSFELDEGKLIENGLTHTDIEWIGRWLDEITPKSNGQLVVHKLTIEDRPAGGQRPVAHRLTVQDRPPPSYGPHPVAHKVTLQGSKHAVRRPAAHKIALEGHPHAHKMSIEGGPMPSLTLSQIKRIMRRLTNGRTSADTFFRAIGGWVTKGYQLRYIYFIDPAYRKRLTVPEIPFSKIDEMGVGMYKGEKRAAS